MKSSTTSASGFQPKIPSLRSIFFSLLSLSALCSAKVQAQNYSITTTDNVLTITDISNNDDTLDITQDGAGMIKFNVSNATRTYSVDGVPAIGFPNLPYTRSLAGITSIEVNTKGGTDVINVATFANTTLPSLTLNGGTGGDEVNFNGDLTFAANANLDVDLQNDDVAPGEDVMTVADNANLILSGTGAATVKVSKNVQINAGGSIETANGNITVEANQQGTPTSGSFIGINVNGALLEATGTGSVTLIGQGGDASTNEQTGVQVVGGGAVRTGSGMINIGGQGGGSGSGNKNFGFRIHGVGSKITTSGGDVTVVGTAGNTSGNDNKGILVDVQTSFNIGGTGSLELTGVGGSGTIQNAGVEFLAMSSVMVADGNLIITGTGGGNATALTNRGVFIGTLIDVGGSGTMTITGIGGVGSGGDNQGILLETSVIGGSISNGVLQSASGEILIKGTEGEGANSEGVRLNSNNSTIKSNGAGNITLIADRMRFVGSASITTAGDVTVRQRTAGTAINLGGADASGTLGLTDAELDRITTGTLNIGDANTGDITVSADITRSASTVINLTCGGEVNLNASALNSAGGNINIDAVNGTNPSAIGTDVITGVSSTLDFAAGDKLNIAINGNTVDAQYRQFKVEGKVDITGVDLMFSGSYMPLECQEYIIINNDGTDGITGTFNGLSEGATIVNFRGSGLNATITYIGGTGNDVVINVPSTLANCPANRSAHISDPAFALTGGSPDGGTYSGPGVSNGMFNPATAGGGTHTITYSYTNMAGCTGTCTFTITVNATACPSGSTVCIGDAPFALTGGTPAGGTYSGPGVSNGNFNPAAAGAGMHTITYTNGSSCTFNITVKGLPTAANAGPDQTGTSTCNQTQVTLAGNMPTLGIGTWSIISGTGGNLSSPGSPTSTFSGNPGATYTLRWTVTNSPCAASTDDVVITFNQNPTAANAGPNQTDNATCGLTQVTLAANAPTVGTGAWSIVVGTGGSFGNASSSTSTFSGNAGATYTLRWTVMKAPCAASTDEMTVTFNQNPTAAAAGDNATVCGQSTNLAGNMSSIGTGAWSLVGGPGTANFGTATSPTSSVSVSATGVYTFRWTVTNAPCAASTDDVVITFTANPTAANAGPNQTDNATCGLTQVTLAANAPTVGTGAWSIVGGTGGSLGNASSPTSTFSGNAGATYTLRWTVTNAPCAASTDDMVVSFNQNPTFSACPPGVTVSTSSGCSATATYTATTANTTPTSSVTYTFSGATSGSGSGTGSGSAFNLGTTTVNLTATNSCGTSSCFFLVIVQAPEANVQGNGMTIPDGDNTPGISDHTDFGQTTGASVQRTFTVQNTGAVALPVSGITLGGANPGQFSLGPLTPPGPIAPNGSATFTVTYAPTSAAIHNATLTLANGDCDESTYDFAIRGELTCTAPAFTACPSTQISLNTAPNTCSAIGTYTVSASGLPAPALTYAFTGATTGSGNGTGSGSSFNKGITTVTVTATNPCGAPVCSFSITVADNQLPTITCPGNSTVNATTGQCAAVVNYSVSGSDNCSGWSLSRTSGLASGSLFPVGTTTVSWKNTDGAGNSTTCSFSVTVNDTQLPGITCPANITANAATGSCAATVNYATPTVSDNCAGVSAMHVSGGTSGSSFNKGVNTVQWKATDAANNTRTCSFSITVNDNQLPSITCPANLTANTGANTCAATVTFNNATATDNCTPPPTVAQTGGAASGSSFPKGLHTITFKATDGAGLTKTCTFRITVVDNVLPTITCPGNIVKNTDDNLCSAITSYTVTGADNCTSVSVSRVSGLTSGSAFPRGVNTVTWRATDLAGNVTLCSFTVTVNDAQGPTITCPQNINVNTTTGQCNRVVNYTTPTYSDNCTGGSISLFSGLASGSVFPTGSSTVIWRAFDNSANSNTCSFMVTVTDNELPVITCPPAASVSGSGSPCGYPANQLSTPSATDNCAVTSLASDAPATLPAGATTITWIAGDATGNQKTCAYVVTVNCGTAGMLNDEIRMMNDAERESASFLTVPSGQALITHNSSLITHHLSLFPNPASDIVVVTLSNQPINSGSNQQPSASNQQINNTSNQQIFIHDALGREVWRKTVAHDVEQLTLDLVAQGLKDGTYQVSWKTTNGLISKTLVLIKR